MEPYSLGPMISEVDEVFDEPHATECDLLQS